jgi:Tfp pilus tip-associated adhesin PilY1
MLYAIDIDEGVILKKFIVGNNTNKVPAGATAFDRDLDGRVDGVYFGDIQGTLWKIKIDGKENAEDWKLIELFKSDGGRPIFYHPAVTKNNQGKVLVYFGQGDD